MDPDQRSSLIWSTLFCKNDADDKADNNCCDWQFKGFAKQTNLESNGNY